MEEQVQNPVQSSARQLDSQQPTLQGETFKGAPDTPWLKYAEIIFVILVVVNLGLAYFYLSGSKSKLSDKDVGTEDSQGFLLTKPDKSISREGYSITFSNPRYEYLNPQNFFRVDVTLRNESIKPSIKVIANCDISENGQMVKTGTGVSVESGETVEILPATSATWTALVILDSKNQKVSSCIYAPEGIFDPNQTIRVVF